MRRIKLSVASSLDNYIARLDGGFDWILSDQDCGLVDFFNSVDTVLIGRKTYDMMAAFGSPSYAGMTNYVFSRTKSGRGEGGVQFVSEDAGSFIEGLRKTSGKDIWLSGGAELIHFFLREKLVDEIALAVQPILLKQGMPLFPPAFPEMRLRLTNCQSYSNGVIRLAYEVTR